MGTKKDPGRMTGVLALGLAEAYRSHRHETNGAILPPFADTASIPFSSQGSTDNPLMSQCEGSGSWAREHTQKGTTGGASADPDGTDTRGSRPSYRKPSGG